jgi:hypothetical protein
MRTSHVGTIATFAIVMLVGACSESTNDGAAPADETEATSGPNDTTSPGESTTSTDATQSTPQNTDTPSDETVPEETVPQVTVDVTGTAVSGNSGGVGRDQTNTLSETVRNEDGSCSGWEGPGDGGKWTQGLENGASVQILDRDTDEQIGDGSITSSAWADVDPGDREQWNCTFVFEGTVSRDVESFKIKVADLQPWVTRPDPTRTGEFVASVDTEIEISRISSCTDHEPGEPIFEWEVVGQFWADGLGSLCSNGLVIDQVNRACRPSTVASEYIMAVRSATDPNVVYEDASGLLVDVDTLQPDTKVVVDVATGRPC